MEFTAVLHHTTAALLRGSFYVLKHKAVPGVDGVTWQEYESVLESRLADLHSRVHRGASYRGQPSRRVHIPNRAVGNGRCGARRWRTKLSNRPWPTSFSQIYEEDAGGSKKMSFVI